jgi:hypothetical protein
VERGIKQALQRVTAEGVFIEGSFSEYVAVDAMIMTIRESRSDVKRSAKRALSHASALYVWRDVTPEAQPNDVVATMLSRNEELLAQASKLRCYTKESFSDLVSSLRESERSAAA